LVESGSSDAAQLVAGAGQVIDPPLVERLGLASVNGRIIQVSSGAVVDAPSEPVELEGVAAPVEPVEAQEAVESVVESEPEAKPKAKKAKAKPRKAKKAKKPKAKE